MILSGRSDYKVVAATATQNVFFCSSSITISLQTVIYDLFECKQAQRNIQSDAPCKCAVQRGDKRLRGGITPANALAKISPRLSEALTHPFPQVHVVI